MGMIAKEWENTANIWDLVPLLFQIRSQSAVKAQWESSQIKDLECLETRPHDLIVSQRKELKTELIKMIC